MAITSRNNTGLLSASILRNRPKHIDDVQAASVDEHFEVLLKDRGVIDPEPSEVEYKDLPDWYDEKLFEKAQDYYQRNMLSMGTVGLVGVLAVIIIPTILKVLIYTKQSGTACTAFKRYFETILHIHTLYTSDIKSKDSNWWKSINTIRWKHSTSSRRSNKSGNGAITQRDMALTQFGFLGYALLEPKKLSLTNEPEEREALNHFWRVLGSCLGISDKMNICRKNEVETTALCRRLLDEIFAKHMKEHPANFDHMSSVLVDGLWTIDVTLNADAIMYLWYKLSGVEYDKRMSIYSRLNALYHDFIFFIFRIPIIGYFVRAGFNRYVKFTYWWAENFPVSAWLRFGKAHAALNMYPNMTKQ